MSFFGGLVKGGLSVLTGGVSDTILGGIGGGNDKPQDNRDPLVKTLEYAENFPNDPNSIAFMQNLQSMGITPQQIKNGSVVNASLGAANQTTPYNTQSHGSQVGQALASPYSAQGQQITDKAVNTGAKLWFNKNWKLLVVSILTITTIIIVAVTVKKKKKNKY